MMFSVAYFLLYFSVFQVLVFLLVFNRKKYAAQPADMPRVSILIAARNEEKTIRRCLQAIEKLDYPKEKIEVLIGDDASTDATRAVVEAFIQDKPNYTCISIRETIGLARGKANVLAHLAKKATTNFYFCTDADIAVPPQWIRTMLAQVQENTGIVTGVTTITGKSLFARLQQVDWVYALGLMQVISDMGRPVSTMGNNMLITREAYEAVGGFENLEFSVTEDVVIFKHVLKEGFDFSNIYDRNVLAWSLPAGTLKNFLHQRRRWMRGSMQLPLYMKLILIMHAAYYPVWLPFFAYVSASTFFAVFGLKLVLQSLYIHICYKRLQLRPPWHLYLLFELYMIVSSVILILYFFMPGGVRWKGRTY
ncbi:glycosyltransferase [Botryobacter ruber]|uniref:glycosyltransferase n=1 Tax=Botryobacter ruber TaxID=2171629 RepID=UPI000E0AAFE0|nr:glycosyltransferase [Botryobacter ruber]